MPSAKRSQKSANPLKELRRLLATGTKLLSTERLGALCGIAGASLRSVETGRRPFTTEMQKRMRSRGLEWDAKAGRWFFTYDPNKKPPTLFRIEMFRRLTRGSADFQKQDLNSLCKRVTALMEHVPDSAYTDLLLDLQNTLEELCERYAVEGAKQTFQQSAVKYEIIKTPSGSETLVKSYSGPMGLADQLEDSSQAPGVSQDAA
jgi:hypothetical protein